MYTSYSGKPGAPCRCSWGCVYLECWAQGRYWGVPAGQNDLSTSPIQLSAEAGAKAQWQVPRTPPCSGGNRRDLRRDGDLRLRILLHLLQVPPFLANESPHKVIMSQDLQGNFICPGKEVGDISVNDVNKGPTKWLPNYVTNPEQTLSHVSGSKPSRRVFYEEKWWTRVAG